MERTPIRPELSGEHDVPPLSEAELAAFEQITENLEDLSTLVEAAEIEVDTSIEALEAAELSPEFLTHPEIQRIEAIATPEANSNPQLYWPEADAEGMTTEAEYDQRLDYRLTNVGFALDAARKHIDSGTDADTWFELKSAVHEAKSLHMLDKLDALRDIEEIAYDFVQRLGATQEDFDAAKNGDV